MGYNTDRNWKADSKRLAEIEERDRVGFVERIEEMLINVTKIRIRAKDPEAVKHLEEVEKLLQTLFQIFDAGKS